MKRIMLFCVCLSFYVGEGWADNIAMQVQLPFVDGEIFSCIQNSDDPFSHNNSTTVFDVDFSLRTGTVVVAAADGIAYCGNNSGGFGNYIKIDHGNGYFTIYAHLMDNGYIIQDSQRVTVGQPIGFSGNTGFSTGSHLHFGVHEGSGTGNSVRMEVKANEYDEESDFVKTGYFATGLRSERRDFVVGHYYEAIPLDGVFNQFSCHALDNGQGILCWQGYDGNFAFCDDGHNHVRYYDKASGYTSESVSINSENITAMCYPSDSSPINIYAYLSEVGLGGGPGGPTEPTDPPVSGLPDFIAEKLILKEEYGAERYKFSQLEKMEAHGEIKNIGDADWAGDRDDMYVKFYLSDGYKEDDHSDWDCVGTTQIDRDNIQVGESNHETVTIDLSRVRDGTPLDPGIYNLVVCPDRKYDEDNGDGEVPEKHKSNNCSTEAVFEIIDPEEPTGVDLTISSIAVVSTPLPVPTGGLMGARMVISNIGEENCPVAPRSAYEISGPGTNNQWIMIDDDGTDADQLRSGGSRTEEIYDLVKAPMVAGTYKLRGRADYRNEVGEKDENNNTKETTFEVIAIGPDLVITMIGLPGGKREAKKGQRIHPELKVKNIGNRGATKETRSRYYYRGPETGNSWKAFTDDGTDAKQLCAGCEFKEEYRDGFKINKSGSYEFLGCADYTKQQSEINETNNCLSSGTITIR